MLSTGMQIALVGLHINKDGNGNLEMTPINLEHFRVPSDDAMMTTTTCTPDGRIFLGGNDGHLYEVEYRNRNSWLKGRCNKASYASCTTLLPHAAPLTRWLSQTTVMLMGWDAGLLLKPADPSKMRMLCVQRQRAHHTHWTDMLRDVA